MPVLKSDRLPKYRHHRASGQAVVTLSGVDHYLGPHGTKASKREYDRVTAEWLANGRRLLEATDDITIVEMLVAFRRFAVGHYRKNGKPTRSLGNIDDAIRPLKLLYGRECVSDFGPLKLLALQSVLAKELSRRTVNDRVDAIKRMFRWAVSRELAPPSIAHALDTVRGLQRGRTEAAEPQPIKPVPDATIEATLPHLPTVVADMVRLQRLTGCRPGEVCALRPCDIERAGDVWTYRPESHKTEHHGRERVIYIGPRAQDILRHYLLRDTDAYCFCPRDSEKQRKAKMREARKTPVQPSQVDRRKRRPRRIPRECYDKCSYYRAIIRACERAGVEPWGPNRLRHTAATEIRKRFGLEAAQVILGHSRADVTQIYAARDEARGLEVVRQIG